MRRAIWRLAVGLLIATEVGAWSLAEVIPLQGVDILSIGADTNHILVLSNTVGGDDAVYVFNPSGELVGGGFSTGSIFTTGITWNGTRAVFGRGSPENLSLYEMDLQTGSVTGPLSSDLGSITGLGFDGTNIMVLYYANGSGGTLTSNIRLIDSSTYNEAGIISVTVNTVTDISATPTYGAAWHDGDLFVALQGVNNVYRFANGVNLVEEIPVPTAFGPRGLAFIGNDLYVADRPTNTLYRLVSEPISVQIAIDIKPDDLPNSINPKSNGMIPVAILTTVNFDATTVNPLSVEFGPNRTTEAHGRGHIEDVNDDGHLDLVLHFNTQDTGIQCGLTSATLFGETFNGQEIQGSDSIQTVGCK